MTKEYYSKAILLGFGLFGAQLMWMLYNTYMPIFLQAGSASFSSGQATRGFGLSATITGIIMTLDNVAAFFIQPIMGPISDKTRTRFGRRMPYILIFAPLSALAFALIPIGPMLIPAGLSGQIASLSGPFAITIAAALAMVLFMALWRTPLFALMPDLFPSPLRSQANAIINIMSGIGGILAFVVGGMLFGVLEALPFWFGAVVTLLAIAILFIKIKEPKELAEAADTPGGLRVLSKLKSVPAANKRSLFRLVLTVFFYMVGYMALETFFSSFAVTALGLKPSFAAVLLAVSYVSFLIFAMPSAALAKRFGRKLTISAGLLVFAVALVAIWLFPSFPMVAAMLFVGGFGWALVNINCLPMILDTSTSEDLMGTYSGLYFIATTFAGTIGPILNGRIIDLAGRDYSVIFIVCPVFFLLSFLSLLGVGTGEVKAEGTV
ncbi:MAG: MFS transporter [Spirochaetae bacterium HGW-Spirochaetae-3]|jgi:Na+/melibiose symporter-like transporter|nr:MAG: MFS transporter [Spirochaetae bacterium HGW-Spirochaetae-3]